MKKTLLVAAALFAQPLFAADVAYQSTVEFVYPISDGSFVIGFTQNSPACSATQSPTKYFWVAAGQSGVTADGVRNLYAAALVALTTEKSVTFAFDDSTSSCYINRMVVRRQ